jgi:hypothetical protein
MKSHHPSSTSAKEKPKPSSAFRPLTNSEVNWLRQHNNKVGEYAKGKFVDLKTKP